MAFTKRNRELLLLLPAFSLSAVAFYSVSITRSRDAVEYVALLAASAIFFILIHLVQRFFLPDSDPYLLPVTAQISFLGLAMIYRLNPDRAFYQLGWMGISALLLIIILIALKNYRLLGEYKYLLGVSGLVLLLAPIFFGVEIRGAKLWLQIFSFSFQPAELAKILLVFFLAAYLTEKKELLEVGTRQIMGVWLPETRYIGPVLMMWGISLAVLILEKDLGSSFLFFALFLSLIYLATGRMIYVNLGLFLFLLGATSCYFLYPHVQTRIDLWLNPWQDLGGKGYQLSQSLFAIASGRLFGSGLGLGYPTLIPAAHTDFIFSAWLEETGFIGGLGLLLLYLLFAYRGFKTALRAGDEYGRLLAGGLTFIFSLQTFVIIAGVTRLIPLTGITLPFFSYGGSSVLANFILLGLLLKISSFGGRSE